VAGPTSGREGEAIDSRAAARPPPRATHTAAATNAQCFAGAAAAKQLNMAAGEGCPTNKDLPLSCMAIFDGCMITAFTDGRLMLADRETMLSTVTEPEPQLAVPHGLGAAPATPVQRASVHGARRNMHWPVWKLMLMAVFEGTC
jgi:hypothetical protein